MEQDERRQAYCDTLSLVSHDIRAPLGVILGAVTELAGPDMGALSDDQRSLLQLVRRSSEKLARLADNVLVVQRIEAGKMELAKHPTDLRLIVRRVIERFERAGEATKIPIVSSMSDSPASANVDTERASHAIANVIANGLRFARREVRVTVGALDGRVFADVEDDGPGISPELKRGLFERQLRPRTSDDKPVGGLGLLVAKAIVDALDGSIEGVNREGAGGARFRISLPAASGA